MDFEKPVDGQYRITVDISTWRLNPGASVVASNSRGTLSATTRLVSGQDTTADMVDGPLWVSDSTHVGLRLKGGVVGKKYYLSINVPTDDDEILPCTYLFEVTV